MEGADNRNLALGARNIPHVSGSVQGRHHLRSAETQSRAAQRIGGQETVGGSGLMKHYEVIVRPLITEKAVGKKDDERTLCFEVSKAPTSRFAGPCRSCSASKSKKYGPRRRRQVAPPRPIRGLSLGWKKAYVRIKEGEKLPEFAEGITRHASKEFQSVYSVAPLHDGEDARRLTKQKPERALTEGKKRTGGRNSYGRLAMRFRGGGHKQRYRVIDFKRDKIGVPAQGRRRSSTIRTATARIALLHYVGRREALHPRARRPEGRATSFRPAGTPTFARATACPSANIPPAR